MSGSEKNIYSSHWWLVANFNTNKKFFFPFRHFNMAASDACIDFFINSQT